MAFKLCIAWCLKTFLVTHCSESWHLLRSSLFLHLPVYRTYVSPRMDQDIEICFAPCNRVMSVIFEAAFCSPEFWYSPQMSELKRGSTPCWQWKLDQWSAVTWKQCEIVCKLLLLTIGSRTRTFPWYHFHWFTLITSVAEDYLQTLHHRLQVCTSLLLSTFNSCVCLSWTVQVIVTCAQLLAVICKSSQLVLLLVASQLCCVCLQELEQPSNHTSTPTLTQFCSPLKTHLFGLAYGSTSWLFRLLECDM